MSCRDNDCVPSRSLGLHERYNVAHDNIGSQKVIHSIAIGTLRSTGQSKHGALDIDELYALLRQRIEHLLDAVPLLSCHVAGKRSFDPSFARDKQAACTSNHVLSLIEAADDAELEPGVLSRSAQQSAQWLIKIEQAPLWRVQLLYCRSSARFAIILHVHHVIADGRAMLEIMRLLVLPPSAALPSAVELAGSIATQRGSNGKAALPPISEDLNEHHRVSLAWFICTMLLEILTGLLFSLPLSAWLLRKPVLWPTRRGEARNPTEPVVLYVCLGDDEASVDTVAKLRRVAKQNDLGSINALVHTAALTAVYTLHQSQSIAKDGGYAYVSTDTPISIRDTKPCGLVSGNFVLQSSWSRVLEKDILLSDLARSYHTGLHSTEQRRRAGRTFSLLPYVFPRWRNSFHKPTASDPTPWEPFLRSRELKSPSYRSSFELSNLGAMHGPVLGQVEHLFWVQPAHIVSHAININVVGWQQATPFGPKSYLALTLSFYRNAFCTKTDESIFAAILRHTMVGLANGWISTDSTLRQASHAAVQMMAEP